MEILESKSNAQKWLTYITDKHNCHHIFKLSFKSDNIIIDAIYSPLDKKWKRVWEWIIPFKNLGKIELNSSNNSNHLNLTLHSKWFRSFIKKNYNEVNNLNPREKKESKVDIVLSKSILSDDEFDIKKLISAFKLSIS